MHEKAAFVNLLFHQTALGDFALTLPIVRGLWATGQRTVVVAPWSRAWLASRLVEGVAPMDIELWEFSRLHAEGGPTSVSPAVEELFEKAQRIVSFVSSGGDHWATNVRNRISTATIACIDPRPPQDWAGHVTEWHHRQLASQGIELESVPVEPWKVKGKYIVIHPGSGGKEKCWPLDRFEQLIRTLRDRGKQVLPVFGEVELATWTPEQVEHWQQELGATLLMTPEALYQTLTGAALFVGNDAGPTHLAAQMGLATIALYGPTDPKRWSPMGPAVTILAPDAPKPMDWLEAGAVLDACEQKG